MAVSLACTAAVSDSTIVTGQEITVILPIVNSGDTPTNITSIQPVVYPTDGPISERNKSGFSVGPIFFGPNSNNAIPGSATVTVGYKVTFHAPSTGILSDGSGTYTVGAIIYTSNGSVTEASTTTVTVDYVVTYPESQQ